MIESQLMRDIFTNGKRRRSLEIARRALPVLVYYASVLNKPITYKELGALTDTFQRSFRHPFGYIHQWMKILSSELGESIPPIPLLVFEKGKNTPAEGGIEWFFNDLKRGLKLSKSDIAEMPPAKAKAMFEAVIGEITRYPNWNQVLTRLELDTYSPPESSINEITEELARRLGTGESPEHKKLKLFIARRPQAVGIKKAVFRTQLEYVFPSLDRADILFEATDSEWICVEVKALDADEAEITRGLYQCLKYTALGIGLKRDLAKPPNVRSVLAMEGELSPSLKTRRKALGIEVIESMVVPD